MLPSSKGAIRYYLIIATLDNLVDNLNTNTTIIILDLA